MHNDRLALLGIKHSGKSSVGLELARRLTIPLVDTDDIVSSQHAGMAPRELFAEHGAGYFRRAEQQAIEYCCSVNDPLIVATGGGIADNGPALSTLSGSFMLIYLVENESVLYDRIMSGGRPPFLPKIGTSEAFTRLYRRRNVTYRRWAHVIVDTHGKDISEVVDRIVRLRTDFFTGE